MVNTSSFFDRVEEMRKEIEDERSQDPELPEGDLETVAELALDEERQEDYRTGDTYSRQVEEDTAYIRGESYEENISYTRDDVVDAGEFR